MLKQKIILERTWLLSRKIVHLFEYWPMFYIIKVWKCTSETCLKRGLKIEPWIHSSKCLRFFLPFVKRDPTSYFSCATQKLVCWANEWPHCLRKSDTRSFPLTCPHKKRLKVRSQHLEKQLAIQVNPALSPKIVWK